MLDEIVASKHEVLMAIKHGEKKYTPKLGKIPQFNEVFPTFICTFFRKSMDYFTKKVF